MSTNIYRLGTANMYDNALRNLGTRQTNLSNLQENLTSGKRVVRASDDPVSAAQAERAITRLSRIQTEQRALETQRNAIAQAESSLGDAVALVQNFRELVVQAGDGSWREVGVVSTGYKCAEPGYPGLYSRLAHVRSWVSRTRPFGPFDADGLADLLRPE